MPTRVELNDDAVERVHAGRSVKADLLRIDLGQGPIVVKDFGAKGWWVRLIGRLQIALERRAYLRLVGVGGTPAFYGRIGRHALAIEAIAGRPLGRLPEKEIDGAERYRRLCGIVEEIHSRGIVHWDLRARNNVLVREDGQLFVIDFASAVCMKPGGFWHRLLFERLAAPDRSALLKWKQILAAGPLDAAEEATLARYERWRRFWIFNMKRKRSS